MPQREEWRPVVGYEGLYEVSDSGSIRSCRGPLNPRPGRHGYLRVNLCGRGRQKTRSVHSLVMEAFEGPCPDNLQVCHGNGVPWDNRRSNLRYGTYSDNRNDSVLHGTHRQTQKTRCPLGYPLRGSNLVASSAREGRRDCRACAQANSCIHHARRSGKPIPDKRVLADYKLWVILGESGGGRA